MTITLYGIRNCDTMKKARAWLDARGIAYGFHDYKQAGIDAARLGRWVDAVGWKPLLNRSGTTFRKLSDAERQVDDADGAIQVMVAHPSCIKRPVVEHPGGVLVGFSPDEWQGALGG